MGTFVTMIGIIGVATAIFFVGYIVYEQGIKDERTRFEKEAIHHGYGTYVLVEDDSSEHGNYEFEWNCEIPERPYKPGIGV